MNHIQGENRNQMFMFSLESCIPTDSFVRVIDSFVDIIDMKSFGFKHVECEVEGRPPYPPTAIMKLYLYGYQNGIRTTRKLQREAELNIEVMWLLNGLRPKYHTIANFRAENRKAFKEIFRRFVYQLKEWELIEGETIGIDSFKVRAQNSLKNNYNEKKIDRHLGYIEEKINEYEQELERNDQEEEKEEIKRKIEKHRKKKKEYQAIRKKLKASGEEQISLTDPDSKAVILNRNIVNVGYNIQASTDAKNKMLVEFNTGSVNDTHALADIAIESKELLKVEEMNVLADKGYHTGEEIQRCGENGITTYVSPRESSTSDKGLFELKKFEYNKDKDIYTCPAGHTMQSNGNWIKHSDNRKGRSAYRFKRYTTTACKECKLRQQCTKGIVNGRVIDRSEYADALEANTERVLNNPDYYHQRQEITEHIFGTLKRQRGFTHVFVRGKEKVLGEVGLMFIGYNLTRCATIFGVKNLIKLLRECYLRILRLKKRLNLSPENEFLFLSLKTAA